MANFDDKYLALMNSTDEKAKTDMKTFLSEIIKVYPQIASNKEGGEPLMKLMLYVGIKYGKEQLKESVMSVFNPASEESEVYEIFDDIVKIPHDTGEVLTLKSELLFIVSNEDSLKVYQVVEKSLRTPKQATEDNPNPSQNDILSLTFLSLDGNVSVIRLWNESIKTFDFKLGKFYKMMIKKSNKENDYIDFGTTPILVDEKTVKTPTTKQIIDNVVKDYAPFQQPYDILDKRKFYYVAGISMNTPEGDVLQMNDGVPIYTYTPLGVRLRQGEKVIMIGKYAKSKAPKTGYTFFSDVVISPNGIKLPSIASDRASQKTFKPGMPSPQSKSEEEMDAIRKAAQSGGYVE